MIEIMAHRGFSGKYPENTLLAFQKAIELDVPWIELDVHICKDGKIVVSHDSNLRRCSGKEGVIGKLTWAQIQQYDLPEHQKIPLLEEVFALVLPSKMKINIELKGPGTEKAVPPLVKKNDLAKQVIYCSFDHKRLAYVHKTDPTATLGQILGKIRPKDIPKEIRRILSIRGQFLNPEYRTLTTENVIKIHQAGLKINGWTPDTVESMRQTMAFGVDIITTNQPELLKSLL